MHLVRSFCVFEPNWVLFTAAAPKRPDGSFHLTLSP
jgi:hypothetical protein